LEQNSNFFFKVATLIERLASGPQIKEEIKSGRRRAYVEDDDEESLSEEQEEAEEEEQDRRKRSRRFSSEKSPLQVPKPVILPSPFGLIWEVPRPEIAEHFIVLARPSGLKVKVRQPAGISDQVAIEISYDLPDPAITALVKQTAHNFDYLRSVLPTKEFVLTFTVPFNIDNVEATPVEEVNRWNL